MKAGAFLGTAREAVHPLPPTLVTMSFLVPPVEHKTVSASRSAFHFPSGKQDNLPPCSAVSCLVARVSLRGFYLDLLPVFLIVFLNYCEIFCIITALILVFLF